jgi:hypothetical protein
MDNTIDYKNNSKELKMRSSKMVEEWQAPSSYVSMIFFKCMVARSRQVNKLKKKGSSVSAESS